MKELLVVIDMQNDFITGVLASSQEPDFLRKVENLILKAKNQSCDVVFTMDTHGEDYLYTQEGKKLPIPHCIKNSNGWELIPELKDYVQNCLVFEKNGFGSKHLVEYAKTYDIIRLIGVCTDICVITNAIMLKGYYPEKQIVVVEDCCNGTTRDNHNAAIGMMKHCQIDIE